MKKLLLATTALAMSAGYAAADVTLSGDARMGVVYDSSNTGDELSFTSRARVAFTLSGETDGGLAFGAGFRADNAASAKSGTAGSVFISGEFGRLTMGDTSGAVEARNGDLHGVGLTGLGDLNEFEYLSNASGGPTARYDYSIEGFSFSLSHTNPGVASKVVSAAASYSIEGFTVGLGAERQNATAGTAPVDATCTDGTNATTAATCASPLVTLVPAVAAVNRVGTQTHLVASVAYTMDAITVKAMYGRNQTAAVTAAANENFDTSAGDKPVAKTSANQYGLSVSGSFDATTVTAFGRRDFSKNTHYGVGASYDLGGGASLKGGIVREDKGTSSETLADFGLSFKF